MIGVVVVLLDCLVPEKIREAFSVDMDNSDDDEVNFGEGYVNSSFLEEMTLSVRL